MPTVLITGGHSGIGLECSRQLAARGVDLVLAGRSPERMRSIAAELHSGHGVKVSTVALDTSSLASVREAAHTCRSMIEGGEIAPVDALVCNAGGRFTDRSPTARTGTN